jgi:hypothetical protein
MNRPKLLIPILFGIVALLIALLRPTQQLPSRITVPGSNNTVLFITNGEHGSSNVFLATAQALLLEHKEIDVHLATFKKRAKDVDALNRFTALRSPGAGTVTFHEIISAPSYQQTLWSQKFTMDSAIHAPGIRGSQKFCQNMEIYLSK